MTNTIMREESQNSAPIALKGTVNGKTFEEAKIELDRVLTAFRLQLNAAELKQNAEKKEAFFCERAEIVHDIYRRSLPPTFIGFSFFFSFLLT